MGILRVYCEAEGNNTQEGLCAEKVFSECLLKKSFVPLGMLAGRQDSPACGWVVRDNLANLNDPE